MKKDGTIDNKKPKVKRYKVVARSKFFGKTEWTERVRWYSDKELEGYENYVKIQEIECDE